MSVPAGLPYVVVQVTSATDIDPETLRVVAAFDNDFDAEQYVEYTLGITPTGSYRKVAAREGGLPYEIVRVLYTKGIDDPDTREQSRDVVAAFADLAFAEAVQEHMRPTRQDVRFMLEGVDEPDMTGSDGAEPPA